MTTNKRKFGASVIAYNKELAKVCDMLDSDIIIMPYSRNEVIIVPKYLEMWNEERKVVKDLSKIIRELHEENNSIISETEFVSENIYVFAKAEKELRIYC